MNTDIVNASGNMVLDEQSRTVTITQSEYALQKGNFMPGFHHVIYASTVTIKRSYKNPGCDLTIYAARVVTQDKDNGGRIDVSGADGKGLGAGRDAVTGRHGTFDGGNGYDGANGGNADNGGDVKIFAGLIEDVSIEFVAIGGAGGRAQDGGDGTSGRVPPPARNAPRPTRPWHQTDDSWDHSVYELVPGYNRILQRSNEAERGHNGGNGGNAGLPGTPGQGGNGGSIEVHTVRLARSRFNKALTGGAAGAVGAAGQPKLGASGGLGGKFLYRSGLGFGSDWMISDDGNLIGRRWRGASTFTANRVSQFFVEGSGRNQRLRLREFSGEAGVAGGYGIAGARSKPRAPKATRGTAGKLAKHVISDSTPFQNIPLTYAVMLQGSIAVALANRNFEEAANILRWLLLLTSAFNGVGATHNDTAREAQLIYREAEQQLLSLQHQQHQDAAERFMFTNIKMYSAFVERSIQRVARQQDQLNNFREIIATNRNQKAALRSGIEEAQRHIEFLTGSETDAGSIEFFLAQEVLIKRELGNLDVQILNLYHQLSHMPHDLQTEIDTRLAERAAMSLMDVIQVFVMAAGLVINLGSTISSVASVAKRAKEFYTTMLTDVDWTDDLKMLIWSREFSDFANDASKLMGSDEWKGLSKNVKSLFTSAIDMHAKAEAYGEILDSRKEVRTTVDIFDVQAKVLIYDVAKLQLKTQRTQLESELRVFLEDYDAARLWRHRFTDFFDTSMTRFNMLAHLSDIAAQRLQLENQRSLAMRNLRTLQEQLNWAGLDASLQNQGGVVDALNAEVSHAFTQGLADIADLHRAYRIWTLESRLLRPVKNRVDAGQLQNLYDDIALRIQRRLAEGNEPPVRTATYKRAFDLPVDELRNDFYDKDNKRWRFPITVPLELDASASFQRLIDAKIFLRGATVGKNSAFFCILRHSGISRFLNRRGEEVIAYQMPREVRFSYMVKDGEPNYQYRGAITNSFDRGDWDRRIRYSPNTSWELEIIPGFKLDRLSRTFNHDIDWSGFSALELRFEAYFD